MATSVNAGGRLDRLPISSFHYRIFWLVGAGMLLDGYDLYVFTNVLPATAQSGFSTALQNADFISKTFLGMTIGAFVVLRSMARRWRAGEENLPSPYSPAVLTGAPTADRSELGQ